MEVHSISVQLTSDVQETLVTLSRQEATEGMECKHIISVSYCMATFHTLVQAKYCSYSGSRVGIAIGAYNLTKFDLSDRSTLLEWLSHELLNTFFNRTI